MIIGLISDSHGNIRKLASALEMLAKKQVQAIVHCGDICCLESVKLLGSQDIPTWLVAGNMDHPLVELQKLAEASNVVFSYKTVEMPLDEGEYLVATHGNDEKLLHDLIGGRQFPYVCHGHTHRIGNQQLGKTRVICPGALKGPRHPRFATAAVLDTAQEKVEFYDISKPANPIHISQ